MQFIKFFLSSYFGRKYCCYGCMECLFRIFQNHIMLWIIRKTSNRSH